MKDLSGMEITVTELDIKRGVPLSDCDCPVARAIRRAAKLRRDYISVCDEELEVGPGVGIIPGEATFLLPKRVENFIHKFDNEQPVKPFKFKIGRMVKG